MKQAATFKEQVYELVAQIPKGRVMTYGQIAALCGRPRAARIVGGVAHYGPTELPWLRVVKKDGSLAEGYPSGTEGHKQALEAEGVEIIDYRVQNMEKRLWLPK
jgi:methylated-DNA-protein-cysteine methyltransferase-like protein